MNHESLEEAINCLSILDVRLDNSTILVDDEFDPLFTGEETLTVQFKSGIKESVVRSTQANEKEEKYLRSKYQCGYRVLISSNDNAEPPSGEDLKGWVQVAEVTADFIAYYGMNTDLDQSAIDEFSKHNVGYNVWPYWREYASSTAVRLRLPPVMPPLYVIPRDKK
jgi:hypothetical protein